ncbi:sensor histidine kinase [Halochromatium glycolicum]|uniref:histidine kinase n=1 Tax=Halochromatium glycolicum TaxID=85075 RepID=A0AAJ0U4P2_9GAMM|nr:HAMP domain-containing sensor histidine kinase [Halochromatium glycolicum]MBK1705204.1 hypothetical protein [Halochromatium glycolicum]
MNLALHDLADHLSASKEEIVDRWRQVCERDAELVLVSRLTREQFRNNIPSAIDEVCRALLADGAPPSTAAIEQEVARHGHHRWKQGFNLHQLIRDWGHFNQVMVERIDAFFCGRGPEDAPQRSLALRCLSDYMLEAASSSVRRFEELRQAQAASTAEDLRNLRQEFEQLTTARGRMLREAAHDLRGGLSAVVSASDVLKLSTEGDQSLSDVLETMDRGIRSVSEMLESLLDLSRLEAGADPPERRSVDIAEVLAELVRQHRTSANEKGLTLRWDGPDSLWVCTDPGKVRRIAQNLLVNALQHTRHGEVRLSCARGKDHWVLEVADTGPGIQDVSGSAVARELDRPERGQSLPQPKTTLSYTGEGIGLTIVKRLCEILDAEISLSSRPAKGSTFRVELPLDEAGSQGI